MRNLEKIRDKSRQFSLKKSKQIKDLQTALDVAGIAEQNATEF